jgi:hypothetical protein
MWTAANARGRRWKGGIVAYSVTTQKTWSRILDDLEESFGKWGGVLRGWRVETVLAPRSATKQNQTIEERTVTLTWARKGKTYAITMKNQTRAVDNLLVIWLIVETLRLNDARGYAQQVAEVYRTEFPALPGPGAPPAPKPSVTPYTLLFVQSNAPLVVCEAAYRALVKVAHPDAGGSDQRMLALNAAIEQIRKEKA